MKTALVLALSDRKIVFSKLGVQVFDYKNEVVSSFPQWL